MEGTNNNYIMVDNKPVTVKEYDGQRVVTFKDIDALHNRPDDTARRNFNHNKSRFIEGEDYFKVCADEIRTHKIIEISNRTHETITLITESGYLMLVKSFKDDLSWKIQRALVNTYFRAKEKSYELSISDILPMVYQKIDSAIMNLTDELDNKLSALEVSLRPKKPNCWLWKKHIATPLIEALAKIIDKDIKDTYDLVYDIMRKKYGFDKSFAIDQFCAKYGLDSASVIDTVADMPEYQYRFTAMATDLIHNYTNANSVTNSHVMDTFVEIESVSTPEPRHATISKPMDKVQEVIQPLIELYDDKSFNGAMTYGKVYDLMKTKHGWKITMTRNRCHNKKAAILKSDKLFNQFVKCVQQLLDE